MRILILAEKKTKEIETIRKTFKTELFSTVDFFTDIDEATYCLNIRSYDLAIVEYDEKNHKKYFNLLGASRNKNILSITPKVLIHSNNLSQQLSEQFKSYSVDFFKNGTEDLLSESLNLLLKDETSIIERDNLIINIKTKEIHYRNEDNETIKLVFKKKIDFFVLLYFIRHYKEVLNISSLLDATCEEPELTKDSIIEASISSIRKTFESFLGINPIKAFKKVGYQFSLSYAGE